MLRIPIIHSRILYVFTFALASLAAAGCNRPLLESSTTKNEPQSSKTRESKKNNVVRLASHKTHIRQDSSDKEKLEVAYEIICRIPTYHRAGAFVESIIPDGSWVEKGDFLIGFDSFNYESELSECRLRLNQAQADLTQAESELQIAKLALKSLKMHEMKDKRQKLSLEIYKLKLEKRNQEAEVSKAESKLQMFEPGKEQLDEAYKSLNEFTKESKEKLATLNSKVRQAEDRLAEAKSLNEQEKVANNELSKARRELEDFESEANSETEDLKRHADFWHDELTQRKREEYPTNVVHENLRRAVAIANEGLGLAKTNLEMAEEHLRFYEDFHYPNKLTELSANIKVAEVRFQSFTAKTKLLSGRMEKLQAIIEQHNVTALHSGQVRYIEDIELDAGVECRNGQVLMSIMRHPLSENDETAGQEKRSGGRGGPGGGFNPTAFIDRMFESDKNGDGKLSVDEVDQRMKPIFDRADADGNGLLTRDEVTRAFPQGRRGGGGAGGF